MRSAGCAEQVASTGDAALRVNSGGKGPVSAEWMIPKVRRRLSALGVLLLFATTALLCLCAGSG